jgi:hypothetical protein
MVINKLSYMETTVNPNDVQTFNAIRFPDGETWMIYSKPDATKGEIMANYKQSGGSRLIDEHYPGLQFGTVTATIQQYSDNLTSGMKDFFTAK